MPNIDKTLSKGLAILEKMSQMDSPAGVSELARSSNLTKSNVHRLLQSLKKLGYIRQCTCSSAYELTPKMWEIGSSYLSHTDIHAAAFDEMHSLGRASKETIHLSVLDNHDVIYIGKIDSRLPLRAYSQLGARAPIYAVATGKAILAHQRPEDLEDILPTTLEPYTDRTLAKKEKLMEELERVRENGYAINIGEWRTGINGIAAPVWNASREVCIGIGITGPAERLCLSSLLDFAPIVVQAAKRISRKIGYTDPCRR